VSGLGEEVEETVRQGKKADDTKIKENLTYGCFP
jgi:hypothetical protein